MDGWMDAMDGCHGCCVPGRRVERSALLQQRQQQPHPFVSPPPKHDPGLTHRRRPCPRRAGGWAPPARAGWLGMTYLFARVNQQTHANQEPRSLCSQYTCVIDPVRFPSSPAFCSAGSVEKKRRPHLRCRCPSLLLLLPGPSPRRDAAAAARTSDDCFFDVDLEEGASSSD